jgi:hypothetical protein
VLESKKELSGLETSAGVIPKNLKVYLIAGSK